MAYADITDVAYGDLADETFYNQILANLRALYNPPSVYYNANEGADYATTSTSWADVDASPAAANPASSFSLLLTLDAPADVLVHFHGNILETGTTSYGFFDITLDGVRQGGDDGCIGVDANVASGGPGIPVSFTRLLPMVAAGAHTINLQWKVGGSSPGIKLLAGAGTSNGDVHPQFWAKVA